MKNNCIIVTSFLEIVSLASVKRARRGFMRRNFYPKETDRLNNAPLQTIAGMIALKRALKKLIAAVCGARTGAKEIVLSHDKNGAPRLVALAQKAGMPDKKNIRISISHSKTHAYGLAVLQQREKRRGA
jgi:phosphopantetheinyl transferase (holo-ACP synthase)